MTKRKAVDFGIKKPKADAKVVHFSTPSQDDRIKKGYVKCERCVGEGYLCVDEKKYGADEVSCPDCEGTGEIRISKKDAPPITPALLEKLAELEHEQWMYWSKAVAEKNGWNMKFETVERWEKLWIPYAQLSEEDKEHDRKWARKVLSIIKEQGLKGSNFNECGFGGCKEPAAICNKHHQQFMGDLLKLRTEEARATAIRDSVTKIQSARTDAISEVREWLLPKNRRFHYPELVDAFDKKFGVKP